MRVLPSKELTDNFNSFIGEVSSKLIVQTKSVRPNKQIILPEEG